MVCAMDRGYTPYHSCKQDPLNEEATLPVLHLNLWKTSWWMPLSLLVNLIIKTWFSWMSVLHQNGGGYFSGMNPTWKRQFYFLTEFFFQISAFFFSVYNSHAYLENFQLLVKKWRCNIWGHLWSSLYHHKGFGEHKGPFITLCLREATWTCPPWRNTYCSSPRTTLAKWLKTWLSLLQSNPFFIL